jgi:hypothetical protein
MVYPKSADIDTSGLFKRIRAGVTPMPWAPPTRQGHPAYELIENARSEHPTAVAAAATPDHLLLDGVAWRVLAHNADGREYRLAFGRWPLSYLATAREVKCWPDLPSDLDEGGAQELVRLGDGRLVSKELLRRERDLTRTQWQLRCCSPFNERLYLTAQRLPIDSPDNFRPGNIHREVAGRPLVFECRPFASDTSVLFSLGEDPWTKVVRYLALPLGDGSQLDDWLEGYQRQQSPLDFVPGATSWRVLEIGENGRPLSAWETSNRELLRPVPETPAHT